MHVFLIPTHEQFNLLQVIETAYAIEIYSYSGWFKKWKICSLHCREFPLCSRNNARRADVGTYVKRITMAKNNSSRSSSASTPMTGKAAARIQGGAAKANGGGVSKGSFAARAQAAAARSSKK